MSAAPRTPPNAPRNNSSSTVIRIALFAVLGYMLFALAYDYMFVFKAHPKKFEEVQALIEKETSRSAEDRLKNGPITNKEVMEVIGFGPSLALTPEDTYFHERYTWHRGLPWMTRDIDVYYIGTKEQPILYSAAYTADDIEESKPRKAIVAEPAPEEKKATEEKKVDEKKAAEPVPTEEKPEEKKVEPKTDDTAPPAEEKKAE